MRFLIALALIAAVVVACILADDTSGSASPLNRAAAPVAAR